MSELYHFRSHSLTCGAETGLYLCVMKEMNRKKRGVIVNILKEKCPHCGEGQLFQKQAKLFHVPVMNKDCPVCHYKFDREPGYFLGAMYISYGIAVFVGIITFLLCRFLFPAMPVVSLPLAIFFILLLISRKNYKLSRVIYIHMFPW